MRAGLETYLLTRQSWWNFGAGRGTNGAAEATWLELSLIGGRRSVRRERNRNVS